MIGDAHLAHDDEVDACSGALEMINPHVNSWGLYEYYRQEAAAAAERSKPQPSTLSPGVLARSSCHFATERTPPS